MTYQFNPLEVLFHDLATLKDWHSNLRSVLKQAQGVFSEQIPAKVGPKYMAKLARGFAELAEIREANDRALRENMSQQEHTIRTELQRQVKEIYKLLEEFRSYIKLGEGGYQGG